MGKAVIRIKVANWSDIELLALGQTRRAPRFLETEPGGTGNLPVPPGHWPGGMGGGIELNKSLREDSHRLSIPRGESPRGPGRWPVRPKVRESLPRSHSRLEPWNWDRLVGRVAPRAPSSRLTRPGAHEVTRPTLRRFAPVDWEMQGRNTQYQVTELPDELPNIVGQIPLESMDWVIDRVGHKLIGNSAHGGEFLHEEF